VGRRSRGEGTVYPNPATGSYTAEVTVRGRRLRKKGLPSRAAGTRWIREQTDSDSQYDGTALASTALTMGEWFTEWDSILARRVRLGRFSETTYESYRKYIRLHIAPDLGHLPVLDVAPRDLIKLYDRLMMHGSPGGRGPLSQRTVAYVHNILRACFRDAITADPPLRRANPCTQIGRDDIPRTPPKSDQGSYDIWQPEQILAFLTHYADHRLVALFWLYFTRGARRGELLGLRWDGVDLEHGTLALTRNRTTTYSGKVIERDTTKGQGKGRFIPLDAVLVDMMKTHKARFEAERAAGREAGQWVESDYVFVSDGRNQPDKRVGTPLHPDRLSRTFKRMITQYNKKHPDEPLPMLRLHDTRHTTATAMIFAGVDDQIVAQLLGHNSVMVTRTVYSHVLKERSARAAALMTHLVVGGSGRTEPESTQR
jgi:integrase